MLRAQKRIARLSLKERAIIHILWLGEEAEAIVESHQVRTREREKDSGGTGLILSLMQSGPIGCGAREDAIANFPNQRLQGREKS